MIAGISFTHISQRTELAPNSSLILIRRKARRSAEPLPSGVQPVNSLNRKLQCFFKIRIKQCERNLMKISVIKQRRFRGVKKKGERG